MKPLTQKEFEARKREANPDIDPIVFMNYATFLAYWRALNPEEIVYPERFYWNCRKNKWSRKR